MKDYTNRENITIDMEPSASSTPIRHYLEPLLNPKSEDASYFNKASHFWGETHWAWKTTVIALALTPATGTILGAVYYPVSSLVGIAGGITALTLAGLVFAGLLQNNYSTNEKVVDNIGQVLETILLRLSALTKQCELKINELQKENIKFNTYIEQIKVINTQFKNQVADVAYSAEVLKNTTETMEESASRLTTLSDLKEEIIKEYTAALKIAELAHETQQQELKNQIESLNSLNEALQIELKHGEDLREILFNCKDTMVQNFIDNKNEQVVVNAKFEDMFKQESALFQKTSNALGALVQKLLGTEKELAALKNQYQNIIEEKQYLSKALGDLFPSEPLASPELTDSTKLISEGWTEIERVKTHPRPGINPSAFYANNTARKQDPNQITFSFSIK